MKSSTVWPHIYLFILLPAVNATAESIKITEMRIDPMQVRAGEVFEVAARITGGANCCLRYDRFGTRPVPPGWEAHGDDHAFLPSKDFPEAGAYKNPTVCHRDNGKRDLDRREGIVRFAIDTIGWPEGTYRFLLLATNRPAQGPYAGESRSFEIEVGDGGGDRAEGISSALSLAINGRRCTEGDFGWPIFPGRPNRLSVELRKGSPPLRATLIRTQPDGRQSRSLTQLSPDSPRATLDLGLFAVPPQFDFEAGVLYRRGCRFRLEISGQTGPQRLESIEFHQTIQVGSETEVLQLGEAGRVPHFGHRPQSVHPLDPPILLWLSPEVLADPGDVRVCFQIRSSQQRIDPEQSLTEVAGILRVTRAGAGDLVCEMPVHAVAGVTEKRLDAAGWGEGRYRIEIMPQVHGSDDHDGPVVLYRRRIPDPAAVRLSPLAPWAFDRDAARPEVAIGDFRKAVEAWSSGLPDEKTWAFRETEPGQVAIVAPTGDWRGPPVVLKPGLTGAYAVFAATERGNSYVRVGSGGVVRGLLDESCFVDVADMTDNELAIHPASAPRSGLRELRLVPVTQGSIDRVFKQTSHPPTPLRGVADWCDYFAPPTVHHSAGARLAPEQFDALLKGHAELGMSSIAWSIGRSWVEYHSQLPNATRFPCRPLETIPENHRHSYAGRATMINEQDPLAYVLEHRGKYGLEILPWLAMQRHYGENAYGGIFCSDWFRSHPEWRRWSKNAASPSGSAVSYYFPEVRKERVDILCEVAERSPDALVIGWCRQVPILLYHPKMVAEYRAKTGVNPLEIDADDETQYNDWIRWRAEFVTQTLRELRTRLGPIREKTGRPIPVVVRIPSKGLFYNMAQGLDVETWCRERLIAEIQLDPLEDCGWRGEPHDVRPYVELGRRHGIPVLGGINGNTFWNYTAILRRALGLLEAGVAGIELYESNNYAAISPRRWIIPLLGNPAELKAFLEQSNLDACYPVWSRNAASGYDNHSFSGNWSVYGMSGESL